jgi:Spy/CpxP family protein refolding chaperone
VRIRPFGLVLWLTVGLAGAACDKNSAENSSSGGAAPSASAAPAATPATSASAAAPAASASAASSAAAADNPQQNEDDDNVRDEVQSHHRHHHRGLGGFVLMAVETLGIGADEQAAVDKIKKEFHQKMKPIREANAAVLQLLADGISAGTIDKAKVDAGVAKVTAASAAVPGATAEVLNQLHAALKPEERAALVDKVDANWAVWKEANGGDQAVDDSKPKGHLEHLAKDLGLTSDQLDKVKASLDASKDAKKPFDAVAADTYVKAFNTAFVADPFDAKKLPASTADNTHIVSWGAERMARFYEALAPVLTADQRTKVADKLKQRVADMNPKEKP